MFNFLMNSILLIVVVLDIWFGYTHYTGIIQLALFFIAGIMFGIFLMNLKLIVKNKNLDSYKRQLEKESITSDENQAKVKVLESKIEVLEKALENALKKN